MKKTNDVLRFRIAVSTLRGFGNNRARQVIAMAGEEAKTTPEELVEIVSAAGVSLASLAIPALITGQPLGFCLARYGGRVPRSSSAKR